MGGRETNYFVAGRKHRGENDRAGRGQPTMTNAVWDGRTGQRALKFDNSKKSMKTIRYIFCVCISICLIIAPLVFADTLIFVNGSIISGTVLQTNDGEILLLSDNAAFNYKQSNLKEIKVEPLQASQSIKAERLPDFKNTLLVLSSQSWATNLAPIPATVVDKGVLRNVPYSSFRCGEDYELNVYGDLEHPAGVEIGIYRKLIGNQEAITNCLKLISELLNQTADKEFLQNLNLKTDYKVRDDLAFEITPPTDSDSYGGWWVSVYSEQALSHARASDEEMKKISLTKLDAAKQANDTSNPSSWSANDLKLARNPTPTTITFINSSGVVISNAAVIRVIDGVSLIYRDGPASGGMVKLADLPETLRNEFGYDAAKTEAADALAKQQKAQWQQQALSAQAAQQSQPDSAAQYLSPYPQYYNSGDYSGGYSSGGGSVYVRGYTKSNGTYVQPHYRSR